jgi:sodium-dependent dicarboxylate transporter 2/3/5
MLAFPAPGSLTAEGWRTAAVASLMACWWMTEAIPIPATALLPLVLFPALGILEMPSAAEPYANEIIYLFMGGFLIAIAMERSGLHKRIALSIMTALGTGPEALVLGFMVATAFLSMWISNTATTTMMLPIALAVGEMFRPPDADRYSFGIVLMLGIAYSASIGGVATLIGTPPNAILAAAATEILGIQIGFVQWMMVGLPVTLVFLPLGWIMLVKVLHPPGELVGNAGELLSRERSELGSITRAERIVAVVFILTAAAWIMRAPKAFGPVTIPGIQTFAPWVRDSTIAMGAAVLLFLLPVDFRKGTFVLDWPAARRIPWGVLVLFGGGLSLARAMDRSGLAEWIGSGVAALETLRPALVIVLVGALFVYLTEVTSNTATSTMAMPVMAGAALGLGMEPITLMTTAALAASMAFMLPVATPPNAIVFGSGYLTIPQMVRAGFWMNLIAILIILLVGVVLVPPVLLN